MIFHKVRAKNIITNSTLKWEFWINLHFILDVIFYINITLKLYKSSEVSKILSKNYLKNRFTKNVNLAIFFTFWPLPPHSPVTFFVNLCQKKAKNPSSPPPHTVQKIFFAWPVVSQKYFIDSFCVFEAEKSKVVFLSNCSIYRLWAMVTWK